MQANPAKLLNLKEKKVVTEEGLRGSAAPGSRRAENRVRVARFERAFFSHQKIKIEFPLNSVFWRTGFLIWANA